MNELGDFFKTNAPADTVIGTYMYPYRLLAKPNWNDPLSATEVIQHIDTSQGEILVTLNGGLFIESPAGLARWAAPNSDLGNLQAKIAFEEKAARLFNLVICEYALHEIVSEPAARVHISAGQLIDGHALITSAGGGREIYHERTLNPSIQLLSSQGMWRMHPVHDMQITVDVAKLSCASRLAKISENLPSLIAGAYSLFSQSRFSEALNDAWIVVEQAIDWFWKRYKNQISDAERKKRLGDSRTYTSAIRIEILHTIGIIDPDLYKLMTTARTHRNKLEHRAKINSDMARETLIAMKSTIEFLCGMQVCEPLESYSVNW